MDKIDTDKLKTVPDDLAKLSNVITSDVVKKSDFRADDYVKKTKFSADIPDDISNFSTKSSVTTLVKDLDDKIDKTKINEYAKKTSLSNYMLTSDFNTKSTALEGKITANDGKITSLEPDLSAYAKKTGVADDITKIKNDYVTND